MGTGLLVWYGASGVIRDEFTLGVLISFIMYISQFFRPLRQLADRFNTLQLGIVSSDRILKLLETKDQLQNTGTRNVDRLKGEVAFNNVWFAYHDEDYVLKDISFQVKAGETVAFVGATGAGKSSIINLITRFYEINKGQILIDSTDIKTYDIFSLRQHIGLVLQDVFLFSDTIENNITLGNPAITREKVLEAAELVGARTFIEKLPGGFDYKVMERGLTLSVGQRQLISFVRALVYDPEIIILDEATSSVDSETEAMIQQAIEKLMKGRTAIVIAHRLATIQKADHIVVLDKGEIIEKGKHEELLNQNGHYAHLHAIQYKEIV
jgi:ATP-binding cassette subfamily B protein